MAGRFALPLFDQGGSVSSRYLDVQLGHIIRLGLRAFAVPQRRIGLYSIGWYLAPYWLVALLVSLIAYGVLGQGRDAAVVGCIAGVLACLVGAVRVLPRADWTGGYGGQEIIDKSDTNQQDAPPKG
jgi:hypothetical protein